MRRRIGAFGADCDENESAWIWGRFDTSNDNWNSRNSLLWSNSAVESKLRWGPWWFYIKQQDTLTHVENRRGAQLNLLSIALLPERKKSTIWTKVAWSMTSVYVKSLIAKVVNLLRRVGSNLFLTNLPSTDTQTVICIMLLDFCGFLKSVLRPYITPFTLFIFCHHLFDLWSHSIWNVVGS